MFEAMACWRSEAASNALLILATVIASKPSVMSMSFLVFDPYTVATPTSLHDQISVQCPGSLDCAQDRNHVTCAYLHLRQCLQQVTHGIATHHETGGVLFFDIDFAIADIGRSDAIA